MCKPTSSSHPHHLMRCCQFLVPVNIGPYSKGNCEELKRRPTHHALLAEGG